MDVIRNEAIDYSIRLTERHCIGYLSLVSSAAALVTTFLFGADTFLGVSRRLC